MKNSRYKKRRVYGQIVIFSVVLSFVIPLAFSCGGPMTDEDRIKAIINDVAEYTREKNLKKIMGYISESYKDEEGLSKDEIKGMVFAYFYQHKEIGVIVTSKEVEVNGDKATATVEVILTETTKIIPESGEGLRIDLKFVKEDGDWMVIRAGWDEIGIINAL